MAYTYRFVDIYGNIIYVGKTIDIDKRMKQHFGGKGHLDKKCYSSVARIEYQKYKTESDALIMETYYITKYNPKYNKLGKSRDLPSITFNIEEKEWKLYKVLKVADTGNTTTKGKVIIGFLYIIIILLLYFIFKL